MPQEPPSNAGPVQPVQAQTGVVTLLFTDIVASTALKQRLGDKAGAALIQQQRALVRQLLVAFPGAEEIETAGDSVLLSFVKPSDAVRYALVLQVRLRSLSQGQTTPLEERIGIHLGEVVIEEHTVGVKPKDLYGIQIDTCARVMSLAKGGQVLMSREVFDNARQVLKGEDIKGVGQLEWLNHGPYLLKGVDEPVEICEVREAGQEHAPGPPTSSEKARPHVGAHEEPVLGWRPAVGQVVPNTRWALERKLGEGGFGEVWLGRNLTTKQARVFKFCFQAERVRFLKRELTLFRLLKERVGDHPNIVAIHDVYLEQPPFYVEMEYAEGKDLRSWCEEHGGIAAVPLETRLEIVAQAAGALQAAHDAGIIHRDVKPANILIGGKGTGATEVRAKLTDFGIGQVVSAEYLKGITRAGFTQTIVGGSASSHSGTQLYMAPEVLAGKAASIRSDIYSLGVVFYQLVMGDFSQPVTGDWINDIEDSLLREDLRHCLAGRPADRFTGAGQLETSLHAWEQRKAEVARRQAEQAERERLQQQAQRRHKLLLASSAVATVLVALALALGFGMRKAQIEREQQRKLTYAADMNLAGQALQQNNLGQALRFLNLHRPVKAGHRDLRGWEWRYLWEKCRSDELATLGQHDGIVQSVAVSPDGRWVASGGWDALLKIWALGSGAAEGRWVTNLHLGGGPVSSVAFSPDGRWLAACTWTNGFAVLRVPGWQLEIAVPPTKTGGGGVSLALLPHTETGEGGVSLAFSADSRLLAVGGEVWSLDTRTRLCTFPCKRAIWGEPAVAWFPNSHTLAGFSNGLPVVSFFALHATNHDATVSVTPLHDELGRWPTPATLVFSPDGNYLAVGCWDNTIRIHAAKDWRQVKVLTNHTAWVSSLAFSKDGQWLASASADHGVKVWRTRDWQETATLRGHLGEVWTLAFTPDSQRLVSGSKDHTVRLWSLAGRSKSVEEVSVLSVSGQGTGYVGLSGACPFSIGPANVLTIWDGQTLRVRKRLSNYPVTNVLDCLPSPDGRFLLMRTEEGGLWLTDLVSEAVSPPVALQTNASQLRQATFSDQAKWLAIADANSLRVWNLKMQPPGQGAALAIGNCARLRFSSDERLLAAAMGPIATELKVLVWEVASGKELARFQPHRDDVSGLEFSPDGTVLATVSYDNTCKVFDLHQRKQIKTLPGQLLAFHSVSFSPDGQRLAAGMGDGGIIIWDVETGREVLILKRQQNVVNQIIALRFHPGGDSLLSVGLQGTLNLWHAPGWAEIEAAEKDTEGQRQ